MSYWNSFLIWTCTPHSSLTYAYLVMVFSLLSAFSPHTTCFCLCFFFSFGMNNLQIAILLFLRIYFYDSPLRHLRFFGGMMRAQIAVHCRKFHRSSRGFCANKFQTETWYVPKVRKMPEQEASGSPDPTISLPAGDTSPVISGIPEYSNTHTQREHNTVKIFLQEKKKN